MQKKLIFYFIFISFVLYDKVCCNVLLELGKIFEFFKKGWVVEVIFRLYIKL